MPVVRLLVDHCVFMQGQTARHVQVTEKINWPNGIVSPIQVTRLQGKRRDKGEHWLRNEMRCIASIGDAARRGKIKVFTSDEIDAERLKARMGGRGIRGDLWNGVHFEHVRSPMARCTWMGSLTIDQVSSREHREEFYRLLLRFARNGIPKDLLECLPSNEFIETQKRNIGRLNEYASLCDVVGKKRYGDAFHYWTALCAGLDYFLTSDKNFLDALREHNDQELIFRAVSPSELVDAIDLAPIRLPVGEGEFVPFSTE